MLRIVKLHIGLFRYIKQELPKQKNIKDILKFFKNILVAYVKEILRLIVGIGLLLTPEYRKQKKDLKKFEQAKKDVINAVKLLRYAKEKMKKAGISRQRIRRFFMDCGRDDDALKILTDDLMTEVQPKKEQ